MWQAMSARAIAEASVRRQVLSSVVIDADIMHHITSHLSLQNDTPPPPLVSITVLFAVERQSRAGGGIL